MTSQDGDAIRVHAFVSGVVQGVGFRWFVERVGRQMMLSGWVRNLPDGRVELEVEGPAPKVDDFLDEVGRGPLGSRVDSVDSSARPPEGGNDFRIRF